MLYKCFLETHYFQSSYMKERKKIDRNLSFKIGNTSASDRPTDHESSAKQFNYKAIYIDAQIISVKGLVCVASESK